MVSEGSGGKEGGTLKPQQREHWYRIYSDACPLCFRTETFRERIYGSKPKDPAKWHVYSENNCCMGHFL